MRQIGVRDAARQTGGIGVCGKKLCCSSWIPEFKPISIRMAKDQGLALNQLKLSGVCGRLRCCLEYEHAIYKQARKGLPKLHKQVQTPLGLGRVREINTLKGILRVQLESGEIREFNREEISKLSPPQNQPAATPPAIRKQQPKKSKSKQHKSANQSPAPHTDTAPKSPQAEASSPKRTRRKTKKNRNTQPQAGNDKNSSLDSTKPNKSGK